ncbi:EamA family transporter [Halocynthiibacter styelae]|uniref:EamA family transporter n=1 Tax=Halocynthiibacter styelae TaxID=2761955 RepID=A0A8J7IUI5_9RHOB|nr:DMT family transporter [Paenihalocynthiibacter styelae]MBI1492648.1 EamA family transporter [Paenihalocynthiibacter styelae]
MSAFIFMSILMAALLHASWNALIKTGDNKLAGMMVMALGHGLIGLVTIFTQPMPEGEVWIWLMCSATFHTAYQFFLGYAYQQGDLSRVYPIARGGAPMLVLLVNVIVLGEYMSVQSYMGIALLGVGIILMARGVFTSGESRRMLPFAIGSAFATAGYSIVDGMGARAMDNAVAYVGWLFVIAAVTYPALMIGVHGTQILRIPRKTWVLGMCGAAASYASYIIAVWAMTQAPIALVTAMRETSILFAVLIGWLIFGEHMSRSKAISAILIVAGVAITRL